MRLHWRWVFAGLALAGVLETRQGDFSLALALGVILLVLAFAANLAFLRLQGRD